MQIKSLIDADYSEKLMSRPVNQLGSTAAEFMQGDIQSALLRGVANEDPKALLIAKMYGASEQEVS